MYMKKTKLLRFILGFGFVLSVIVILVLIIAKYAIVQKNLSLTMSQEKSKNSAEMTPSNKNWLLADPMASNQTKRGDEISNPQHSQSQLLKKIKALESAVAELMVKHHSGVNSESIDNNAQEDDGQTFKTEEEKILEQIKAEEEIIQERIQSEPLDVEWSNSAIKALYESVQEKTTGGIEILSADCRSTLCRVDFLFDTTSSDESLRELKHFVPWNSEGLIQIDDINSGQAVLYIAREGYSLPRSLE